MKNNTSSDLLLKIKDDRIRPPTTKKLLKKYDKCPSHDVLSLQNNIILKAVEISDLVKTPFSLLIFEDLKKTLFFIFVITVGSCTYIYLTEKPIDCT